MNEIKKYKMIRIYEEDYKKLSELTGKNETFSDSFKKIIETIKL